MIINFGDRDAPVPAPGGPWRVEVSTEEPSDGEEYAGIVPGPGAVVLSDAPC